MEIKNLLNRTRAKHRLKQLAGFKKIKHIEIPYIPKERTLFPKTDKDYWYSIEIPLLDVTACVYELGVGSMFLPHTHKINSEQIIPITHVGAIEVVTDKYIKEIHFPESIYFNPNEPHAIVNKSKVPFIFIVIWSPKMEGWEGSFLSNEKNQ